MGLDDPTAKMSKSSTNAGHAVRLDDDDAQIIKAFKRSVTDSGRDIAFSDDPEKAGVNNLLGIYRAVTAKSREEVLVRLSPPPVATGTSRHAWPRSWSRHSRRSATRYRELVEDAPPNWTG